MTISLRHVGMINAPDAFNVPDTMLVEEIIGKLEDIEAKVDALQKEKSWFYKLADMLNMDVQAIRQVLHYRRECLKHGEPKATKPSAAFLEYLKALVAGR